MKPTLRFLPQISERGARPSKKSYRDDKPRGDYKSRDDKPRGKAKFDKHMAPVARPGSDDTTRKSRHKKTDFSKPARKDHGDAVVAKGGKPAKPPYKPRDGERPAYKGK